MLNSHFTNEQLVVSPHYVVVAITMGAKALPMLSEHLIAVINPINYPVAY